MTFEEAKAGDILVLTLTASRLAADVAAAFKQGLAGYVAQDNKKIVLDMSRVSFVDSTALGALIGVLKLVGSDGELVMSSLHPNVASMFKLTRMNKVFRIFDNRDDAISALS
jgi:anti-sigma B factor antagonist